MGDSQEVKDTRKFIFKGKATEIAAGKSVVDALGTDGTTELDTAYSLHGVLGVNDAANAYDSSVVTADADGSILERLEHLLQSKGRIGTTSALGTQTTAIDAALTEANDYWNSLVFLQLSGANAGQARPIVDFDAATDTLTFEPPFNNAVAAAVNYIILTQFDASQILGYNDNDNYYDSSNVVANEDGSVLERLEQIQEAVNRGAGSTLPAAKSIVDILGTEYVDGGGNPDVATIHDHLTAGVLAGTGTAVAANKSLCDALGSNGTTVTDSAVSVLGAVGANNNNNAFASGNVVADVDGSVLERLEDMRTVSRGRSKMFWSHVQPTLTIPAVAANLALPSITLPNYPWTIDSAWVIFKFRKTEDTSGARNNLNGDSDIQVQKAVAGAWIDAIDCDTNIWDTLANAESGGDIIVGDTDVVAQVDAMNQVINFQTDLMQADGADLVLHDVQVGLMIWYHMT